MGIKNKIIFLLPVIFAAFYSSTALSAEHRWGAISIAGSPGWQIKNSSYSVDGGALVLVSGSAPRLESPPVSVPGPESVLEIILVSPADGTGALGFGLTGGRIATRYFKLSPGRKVYGIYLGDIVREGNIEGFVAEFYGGAGKEYRLESIRFFKPSYLELMRVLWDGFREPETVKVSTINSITTPAFGPVPLPVVLYGLIVVIAAGLFALARLFGRRPLDRPGLSGAVAAAFFIAAVLLAARMDYNWVKLIGEESRTLSGKSVPEKIREMNGTETAAFLAFIDFVKKSVPEGKTAGPAGLQAGERLATMARYYLLPVVTSSRPDYVWVYNDAAVHYDPLNSSLKKGGRVVASPVRPYTAYSAYSAVYESVR